MNFAIVEAKRNSNIAVAALWSTITKTREPNEPTEPTV